MPGNMPRRDRGITHSLGYPLHDKVKKSRVLLVGAGGIGCEVLKNLVCSGFATSNSAQGTKIGAEEPTDLEQTAIGKPTIVVVDLDTIDLSNLNRQFLFRKQHIKKPKAFVAKETASQFNPSANIEPHHASIFDAQYNVDFFESFDVVFNALDNLAARRHVNKMCLAADVPLVESGTTGFNGQVQAIRKGRTECYDCNPKPVQKSFPICTIRSTPSQPIHCIVWAKSYLFPELFGTSEEDSPDMAVTEGDNTEEVAKLREEAEALKKIRGMMGTSEFSQEVFNKVFHEDIERLKSMTEMWQSRKPPESLAFDTAIADKSILKQGQAVATRDQKPWNLLENISVFCYSLEALSQRSLAGEKIIEFDKDDKDTLDFVAAAANLRSYIFGVPLHSEFDIKQMAGNIIPAIATSNALAASLSVLEAFKILRAQPSKAKALHQPTPNNHLPTSTTVSGKEEPLLGGAKMVFLASKSTERMLMTQPLVPPAPSCPVCSSVYAKLLLPSPTTTTSTPNATEAETASLPAPPTLDDLVTLLRARVGYEDFSIAAEAGIIFDPDLDDNVGKPLSDFGIVAGGNGFLTVMDDADEGAKVDLVLAAGAQAVGEASLGMVPERVELPVKVRPVEEVGVNGSTEMKGGSEAAAVGEKRKREAGEELENGTGKKARASDEGGAADRKGSEDVVVVGDYGAIDLTAD